jgi:hypothetical protein
VASGRTLFAVCGACLGLRDDLDERWIRDATAGKNRTTHYCSDDFAFVAPEGVFAPTKCARCRNSDVIVAVDAALVRTIAEYLADPDR